MVKEAQSTNLPEGITKREDGRYMGRFRYAGERYTIYGKSIKETEKKLADLRYEVEHGLYAREENITVSSWFEIWISEYKSTVVKQGTISAYRVCYDTYIKSTLGKKKLKDIRPEHIQKLYNDLFKQEYSRNTIELVSIVLSGMYKQALKNKLIRENPVPLATLPRMADQLERRVMTVEEQKIFMEYSKESIFYDMLVLALRLFKSRDEQDFKEDRNGRYRIRTYNASHLAPYLCHQMH